MKPRPSNFYLNNVQLFFIDTSNMLGHIVTLPKRKMGPSGEYTMKTKLDGLGLYYLCIH